MGTRIVFEITPDAGRARLRFTHAGFRPGYPDLGNFSYLWAQYMRSIKLYLETGAGEPFGSAASGRVGTTPRQAA